jgi:hypothetical protein
VAKAPELVALIVDFCRRCPSLHPHAPLLLSNWLDIRSPAKAQRPSLAHRRLDRPTMTCYKTEQWKSRGVNLIWSKRTPTIPSKIVKQSRLPFLLVLHYLYFQRPRAGGAAALEGRGQSKRSGGRVLRGRPRGVRHRASVRLVKRPRGGSPPAALERGQCPRPGRLRR